MTKDPPPKKSFINRVPEELFQNKAIALVAGRLGETILFYLMYQVVYVNS